MRRILYHLLVILLWAGITQAAPAPSTVSVANSVLSISGSAFGAKSPAAPILWENFESGVAGANLPTTSRWIALYSSDGGAFSNPAIDYLATPGTAYSGTLAAYNHFKVPSSGSNESFNTSYYLFTPTDRLYYSYQWRWEATSSGDTRTVTKAGRMLSDRTPLDYYTGSGNSAISTFDASGPHLISLSYSTSAETPTTVMNQNVNPDPYKTVLAENAWNRHEMYKKLSTPGVADGEVWFAVGNYIAFSDNTAVTRAAGETYQIHEVLLGLMTAGLILGSETETRMWVDDVYVDNTQARVEVCDSSTWAARTHCEPQIPLTWGSGEITATQNLGSFTAGSSGFVYVIDENGLVNSNGVAMTFGGVGSNGSRFRVRVASQE